MDASNSKGTLPVVGMKLYLRRSFIRQVILFLRFSSQPVVTTSKVYAEVRMKLTRRNVLKTAPALAALGWADPPFALAETSPQHSSFDPWVEVHQANVRHNVSEISRRVAGRPIMAVIKNNGYGAGIINIARVLEPMSEVAGLAVVKLQEAMTLRDGGVRKPVLLMGPFDEENLEDAVARDITPMVYTPLGDALDRIAAKQQKKIPIHICVDTGIGRVGVPYWKAEALIRDLVGRSSIEVKGTMMTFTEDPEFDKEQLKRFNKLCGALEGEGIDLGLKHASSSYGLFQNPESFLDMVRPGMSIFGVYSEPDFREAGVLDLRPALGLKAKVIYVKKLRKDDGAGYNRAYVAKAPVWVATIPVGHTDGWPRNAAKGARVRIGGRMYPVIAAVSASHSIVEVGEESRVSIGDEVTVFDWEEGSRPEDVSEACKSSVYDLTMHLNPLLPRRLI
jgi:alanine racemase